jgi:hypothetical protein
MEDLAAKQRLSHPWARMRHLWCSDGGFAAVYDLDFTPARSTHNLAERHNLPKALNLAKRHTRLQSKPLPNANA